MISLFFTKKFKRRYKKYSKKNPSLKAKIDEVLLKMSIDPFQYSLSTHKVSGVVGSVYASRVTGDLRVLWDLRGEEPQIIDLLDLGGHSGKTKVYK